MRGEKESRKEGGSPIISKDGETGPCTESCSATPSPGLPLWYGLRHLLQCESWSPSACDNHNQVLRDAALAPVSFFPQERVKLTTKNVFQCFIMSEKHKNTKT